MKLRQYLKKKDALERSALRAKLEISNGRFTQLLDADEWPPELALKAEEATAGMLDASKLSGIIARARQIAA